MTRCACIRSIEKCILSYGVKNGNEARNWLDGMDETRLQGWIDTLRNLFRKVVHHNPCPNGEYAWWMDGTSVRGMRSTWMQRLCWALAEVLIIVIGYGSAIESRISPDQGYWNWCPESIISYCSILVTWLIIWYWKSTLYSTKYFVVLRTGIPELPDDKNRKKGIVSKYDQSTWISCELVFPILFGCSYIIVSIMYNTGIP